MLQYLVKFQLNKNVMPPAGTPCNLPVPTPHRGHLDKVGPRRAAVLPAQGGTSTTPRSATLCGGCRGAEVRPPVEMPHNGHLPECELSHRLWEVLGAL